jgi:TRAP-type C4-dicarboxylate transport system permease small subunit
MSRFASRLSTVSALGASSALAVACAALVSMTGVEAWQVFGRYVLNESPSWTEPVALLLMSTAAMLGAAVGVRAEAHFAFPLVVHLAPPPVRRALERLACIVILAIGSTLAGWGGALLADGWGIKMAGAPLPQGLWLLPVCVGGALIALFAVERMIAVRVPITGHAPAAVSVEH